MATGTPPPLPRHLRCPSVGVEGRWLLPLVLFLFFAGPLAAQDTSSECDDSLGQNGLNACAWANADKADLDMAASLAKARATMEAIDKDVSEVRPNPAGGVEALEKSQRGWLEYREGRCVIAGFAERGGSMEPMMVAICHEEMTSARITELNTIAEEE